jgi:hypothetical protein
MKKVVRLTESDLARIVKRVISEQKELDYWTMAKQLDGRLGGFKTEGGKNKVASILNQIQTEEGWKEIQRTYGKPNGKDLITSLREYLGADYSRVVDPLMQRIKGH